MGHVLNGEVGKGKAVYHGGMLFGVNSKFYEEEMWCIGGQLLLQHSWFKTDEPVRKKRVSL